MKAPAGELEVVGQDEEHAEGNEQDEPGLEGNGADDPIAHATPTETAASATSTAPGMLVRSGRPLSSSSACAPIPTASPNAATAAPRRPQATTGARQPPTTTYERCQAVYGRWSSVT